MRRLLALILAPALLFAVTACQNSPLSSADGDRSGLVAAEGESGEILSPDEDGFVFGEVFLHATFDDNDGDDASDDPVFWAVRLETCAAGTNTVAGNVDGFSTAHAWNGEELTATVDGLNPGWYCFVFNPGGNTNDVRLTRWFWVVSGVTDGGGHLLEEGGFDKRKDFYDVSFGGAVACGGDLDGGLGCTSDLLGEWQVVLHNVPDHSGSTFHASEITDLNFFASTNTDPADPDACIAAMNFTANGTFDGIPGYTLTFRAGDSGDPASESTDTVRLTITGPGVDFDTSMSAGGVFPAVSDCVGSARSELDTGNVRIEFDA